MSLLLLFSGATDEVTPNTGKKGRFIAAVGRTTVIVGLATIALAAGMAVGHHWIHLIGP